MTEKDPINFPSLARLQNTRYSKFIKPDFFTVIQLSYTRDISALNYRVLLGS